MRREPNAVPTVAVIIPVRDAESTVARAVSSALAQDGVTEVVLAVAPSSDATGAVVASLSQDDPRVTVVDNPSGTTPAGLNAAIRATDAEILVRVDAHAQLPDGYVGRAVEQLRVTGAANVGGRQVPVGEDGFSAAVAAAMRSPLGSGGARYRTGTKAGPVDTVYLGVFRRDALEAVGFFDERFRRNQDAELNERLRTHGHVVWFDPGLAVEYRPRGTLRALARQYVDYGRYRRLTVGTHRGSLRPRQLAPVVLLVGLVASVLVGVAAGRPLIPLAAVAAYGLLLVGGGVRAAGPRLAPAVALALATMHLTWAAGFLLGPPRGAGRQR